MIFFEEFDKTLFLVLTSDNKVGKNIIDFLNLVPSALFNEVSNKFKECKNIDIDYESLNNSIDIKGNINGYNYNILNNGGSCWSLIVNNSLENEDYTELELTDISEIYKLENDKNTFLCAFYDNDVEYVYFINKSSNGYIINCCVNDNVLKSINKTNASLGSLQDDISLLELKNLTRIKK